MLSTLTISNFALIEKCELDFKKGFNVILGQSGAGKSILISALSFVLGAKADKTSLRHGAKLMRVEAEFCDVSPSARVALCELSIECDDNLIISRTLTDEGKSTIRVNGEMIVLKNLKEIAESLVDFCGQHDSVGLLNSANHLSLLDEYVGSEASILLARIEEKVKNVQDINKKMASLGGDAGERERLKEILKFQVDEIENAHLDLLEEDELRARFDYISSAENIMERVSGALAKLERNAQNASALIYEAKNLLSSLGKFENIMACTERLENSYYEIKDIVESLEEVEKATDFDETELERIDRRLDLIKDLKRKYGGSVEAVLNFAEDAKQRLAELENSESMLVKLSAEKSLAEKELNEACETLSNLRKKTAVVLEQKLKAELDELQMKGTNFKVNFEKVEPSKKGFDQVKFVFSANAGQDMKDLSKTASGGELSRLLLAFKNIMLDKQNVSLIVFDEIDAGISGQTAGKVAEKLEKIAKYVQVVCITHTAVVAGRADAFILVQKMVENGETFSIAKQITGDAVVSQIASLIDGKDQPTQTALSHAKMLLK